MALRFASSAFAIVYAIYSLRFDGNVFEKGSNFPLRNIELIKFNHVRLFISRYHLGGSVSISLQSLLRCILSDIGLIDKR